MSTPVLRRQFTVHDYTRMRETGILTEDDRVELLDGEIYLMSPLGSLHIAIVNRLNKLLMWQVGDDAILSIQNPVQLNDYSEPQPMQGQYTQINKVLFGNTIQSKTMQQIAFTSEQIFQ
jgi:putative restriction endonuclease